jgi:hypothetical protein
MAQPQGRYGLSARRMVVLWTFRAPALCRRVHRAFMRNAVLDYTPIIPTTACHQSSYVETYSRFISRVKQTRQRWDPRKCDLCPAVLDFGPVRFILARHFGFCFGVEGICLRRDSWNTTAVTQQCTACPSLAAAALEA